VPPADRQFWWAFVGRFFFILSFAMTIVYQLYILTDYMGLARQQAGNLLGTGTVMFAVAAAICTLAAGVLSDRFKRRKIFVIGASLLVAVATVPLAIVAAPWTLLLFFGLAGCGFGIYISVDQALMVEVLPDDANIARDLSFLSSSNSLPLACAPAVAGLLATSFGYAVMFDAAIAAALIGAACIFGIRRVR
jgi:MFS family permease